MLILQILAAVALVILILIYAEARELWRRVLTISHQLEYLGAPLERHKGGLLVAKRRPVDDPEADMCRRHVNYERTQEG